jgi:hypothetical protein
MKEVKALVLAFRNLKLKNAAWKDLRDTWDAAVQKHKIGVGENPQHIKRGVLSDLRIAEAQFWTAVKVLDNAIE